MVRAGLLELDSKFSNFLLEVQQLLLNVAGFLVLEGQDGFLNGAQGTLRDLNELGLAVLKFHEEVFFHLDTMFLEEHNGLLHGLNLIEGAVLDHLDITEVSHYLHEDFLLTLGLAALRDHLDAIGNLIDELLDVVDLSNGVGKEERSVGLYPL